VFLIAFLGLTTLLISGTGTGKTAVLHVASILLGGFTIVIVPLHGLGSEQTNRANAIDNIEAYHLDAIKHPKRRKQLCQYLLTCTSSTKSVILFASPQTLDVKCWKDLIQASVEGGKITAVFVDEAHSIVLAGKTFRSEFLRLWKNLFQYLPTDVPIMAVTATMTEPVLSELKKILNLKFDEIV